LNKCRVEAFELRRSGALFVHGQSKQGRHALVCSSFLSSPITASMAPRKSKISGKNPSKKVYGKMNLRAGAA
jgi:hypothetical protein